MSQTIGEDGQSFFGYCGIAEESTYGEGVAPEHFVNVVSDGFQESNNPIYLDTTRGRDTYEAIAGEYDDDGSIDTPVTPEAIGLLLKAAFGESSMTTDDPDGDSTDEVGVHTFTTSDKIPSLSVELGLGNVTAVRHTGVGVESLDLEHSSGERLGMSLDLPSKEPDGSISRATPSYDSHRALVYHDADFQLFETDRTPDLRDVTPSITNNVNKQIRGSRTPSKMTVQNREVTFDVTLDFENTDIMERFWGSTGAEGPEDELHEGALNVKWISPETIEDTSTQFSLEVDAPRVVMDTRDAQLNQSELMAENVELRALVDTGGDGYDVQATLTNGRTSAY